MPSWNVDQIVLDLGPKVSASHHAFLEANVTEEEIRTALWSIGDLKASGPDGFNVFFYKHSWHLVKREVVTAVKEFFYSGKLLCKVNATSLVLMPKVDAANRVMDYRLIACCNTVDKFISKILSVRLHRVLVDLVDGAQGALVINRSMAHNILLSQELLLYYTRKRFFSSMHY